MNAPDDVNTFNPYKFENMFKKYMQVLDTDYDDFMVLFTCQENAEFLDQSDMPMDHKIVFEAANNQREFARKPVPEKLYDLSNYTSLKGIKFDIFHKKKV